MSDPASMLDSWSALFAKQDGAGLARLYTPTCMFLGSTPDIRRGQAAVEDYFASLQGLSGPSVAFSAVELNPLADGVVDLACVAEFAFGGPPVRGRITWTLVEQDGGWRIACHHASPLSAG